VDKARGIFRTAAKAGGGARGRGKRPANLAAARDLANEIRHASGPPGDPMMKNTGPGRIRAKGRCPGSGNAAEAGQVAEGRFSRKLGRCDGAKAMRTPPAKPPES